MDCCYSTLLKLLRVKTRVCSYNLHVTPFLSYPSHLTLVKLMKLKRTQTVCTEEERKRERKIEKTERKQIFFSQKKFEGGGGGGGGGGQNKNSKTNALGTCDCAWVPCQACARFTRTFFPSLFFFFLLAKKSKQATTGVTSEYECGTGRRYIGC